MVSDPRNSEYYPAWLKYIEWKETRDAFKYIVDLAASLKKYQCYLQHKGAVRDFRFIDLNGEQPFSFITNQKWLLFYFRPPAVRSGRYDFSSIEEAFGSTSENKRGEWTIRLRTVEDVKCFWDLLQLE